MTWVRERLRMTWVIFETWWESLGFSTDELLHALGGALVGAGVWLLPPLPGALWAVSWLGYLREVKDAQHAGSAHPWNPLYWSDHRLREAAAWTVGCGLLLAFLEIF